MLDFAAGFMENTDRRAPGHIRVDGGWVATSHQELMHVFLRLMTEQQQEKKQ